MRITLIPDEAHEASIASYADTEKTQSKLDAQMHNESKPRTTYGRYAQCTEYDNM